MEGAKKGIGVNNNPHKRDDNDGFATHGCVVFFIHPCRMLA